MAYTAHTSPPMARVLTQEGTGQVIGLDYDEAGDLYVRIVETARHGENVHTLLRLRVETAELAATCVQAIGGRHAILWAGQWWNTHRQPQGSPQETRRLDGHSGYLVACSPAPGTRTPPISVNTRAQRTEPTMARAASTRPVAVTKTKVGRPESLPWKTEMPFLIEARRKGMSYTDLADHLADRYGVIVTPQTVRTRVAPHLGADVEKANAKARESERSEIDTEDSLRIAQWMLDHPSATRREAAKALNIPLYRVELLMPLARTHFNGYLVPPAKPGREQFTDAEMLDALRQCAKHTGIRKGGTLSQGHYAEWREAQDDGTKATLPSPIAYRRRFGTWTNACESAGLSANALPRTYDGLSVEDIIVWIATWLRDLGEQDRGLVDASQGEYRLWLRTHPQAPSEELIRMRGTWANLLSAASVLEKTVKKLPQPKNVGTEGRVKKATRQRRQPLG